MIDIPYASTLMAGPLQVQTGTLIESESHDIRCAVLNRLSSHHTQSSCCNHVRPAQTHGFSLLPLDFTCVSNQVEDANFPGYLKEITMGQEPIDLPQRPFQLQLLDEVMDDLEDMMDVDEAWTLNTHCRMDLDVEADSESESDLQHVPESRYLSLHPAPSAKMVIDPCSHLTFDEFVQYFSVVLSPSSWMGVDSCEWGETGN